VADYYSKIAMTKTKLPAEAKHLAWLDLDKDEGQEYWIAMNLAGEYASANHHEIHNKIARALGVKPITHDREPPQLCLERATGRWYRSNGAP
jgi:tRNA-splicing ligase RtcB